MKNISLCFFCLLWLFSCHRDSPGNKSDRLTDPYFDLSGYVQQYIGDSLTYRVVKTISINDITETKTIDHYPLWKDLKDFDSYDINRPALFDKYSIDSVMSNGGYTITYQPLDPNKQLKVSLLQIEVKENKINSIQIKTSTQSFLDHVTMDINWKPESGYSILRQSDKIFSKEIQNQRVEVFIKSK